MEKYVYIKNNSRNTYIDFEELMDPKIYDVGYTFEDYLNGKFVLLSEEQIQFHLDNPEASVKEVFELKLREVPVVERTLEDAKYEMLFKINNYDNSPSVNSFTINREVSAWFTSQERANYKNSIDSAKILGVSKLSFFVKDVIFDINTELAERMLAAIQLYADTCYIVTKQHKLAIEELSTIEEVDNYNYMEGYPEKLNFNLD